MTCRRNAEMEKEIADLRRRLATNPEHEQVGESHTGDDLSQCSEDVFRRRESSAADRSRPVSVPVEAHPSMATPLTMQRSGSILSQEENTPWRLEDIALSRARVARLFEQYVHPFAFRNLTLIALQGTLIFIIHFCPF